MDCEGMLIVPVIEEITATKQFAEADAGSGGKSFFFLGISRRHLAQSR
jgi:hypothetical protein